MDLVWRERFRVRFFEAEPGGRATVPALCRYLQETADAHCRPHGLALSDLRAAGRMWVLTRLAVRFTSLPRLGDDVAVETWGSNRIGAARAYRDFRMFDAGGRIIAEASSAWLILDTATRRPVRLPPEVLRFRHPERRTETPVDAEPLEAPERADAEERVRVFWRDLDTNSHANNVCYLDWALETVPVKLRAEGALAALDIQFLNEAFLGQEVVATADHDGLCYRHALRTAEGTLLALARTEWQ